MAVITQQQAIFKCGPGGGTIITRGGFGEESSSYEDDGQTWQAGAWLVRASDGEIEELAEGAPDKILGKAIKAASGVAGTGVFYAPLVPGSVLVLNVYHGTAGSAVTAITQLDVPHWNLKYVSGKLYLDIQTAVDTAKPLVRMIRILDTVGDQYGRVEAQVLDTITIQG